MGTSVLVLGDVMFPSGAQDGYWSYREQAQGGPRGALSGSALFPTFCHMSYILLDLNQPRIHRVPRGTLDSQMALDLFYYSCLVRFLSQFFMGMHHFIVAVNIPQMYPELHLFGVTQASLSVLPAMSPLSP